MANCKKCGAEIAWKRMNGRWRCENPDGSDHWDLCAERRFQQIKAEGTYFETKHTQGYKTRRRTQFTRIGGTFTGREIDLKNCQHCVPAWETCPHGCQIAFATAAQALGATA